MDPSSPHPKATPFESNQLLAAAPLPTQQRFSAHLRPVLFHSGTSLFERGSQSETVYFPKSGIISLVLTSVTGIDVEVGLVGPEGVAGAFDALIESPNATRVQVQIAGSGWQLPAALLREEFEHSAEFRRVLMRYQRLLSSIALQSTLCNRLHSVEQRLAKWLLLVQDRVQSNELELTHEFIGTMLGSRREAVTLAANSLREVGLLTYQRGIITILDRHGMEHLSCECYPLLRAQYEQSP